jgi:CRP-like cAMP-binding protein
MQKLDPQALKLFNTFRDIGDMALEKLVASADVRKVKSGSVIVEKIRDTDQVHFLLQGSVEVRTSFFDRKNFSHQDSEARGALEEAASNGVAVTASTDCEVVKFYRTQVEAAEAEPFTQLGDTAIDRGSIQDAYLVEETANQDDDWLSRFLMSPMVGHLSAADIPRMLGAVREVHAEQGQVIIDRGQPGDNFYIVKSGTVIVNTDPAGAHQGMQVKLHAGDYFGEEALVGETRRNAQVVMATDGVLCAMDGQFFNEVIRQAVIITTPEDQLDALLAQNRDEQVVLDVRFYPEYRQGHRQNSRNLPLSQLRNRLRELDGSKQYYITPEGGPRSELATFIMRQAGFDAVLITPV